MRRPVLAFLVLCCTSLLCAQPAAPRIIQTLEDFESRPLGDKRPGIVSWNWTPQQKDQALSYSSCEIVTAPQPGQKCLKLSVSDQLPPGPQGYRMIPLGVDYLPSEADAVTMRVKSLKGRITLSVGGPTVYFGHSDVQTRALALDPATHADWTTIEFSLNHDLTRNMRRAQWSARSPVIHYTRWIQEPLAIYVLAGSAGDILIDQIELVSRGEGKPFASFTDAQVRPVGPANDFEADASMEKAFTIFTSSTDQPKFDQPPQLVRKNWPPPQIARVAEGKTHHHSLQMTMTGAEEVCFAGVKLSAPAASDANAIALTVKPEYAGTGRPGVVLDFLLYASPANQRDSFPWEALRPPPSWRNEPTSAFTYYLNPRNPDLQRSSFAMFHTRRMVANGEWTTLVLPLADFICNYGQGDMAPAFQTQAVPSADQVIALTFLSYFGQNAKPLRLLIDEIRFVQVPGQPETLRSYYQPRATP